MQFLENIPKTHTLMHVFKGMQRSTYVDSKCIQDSTTLTRDSILKDQNMCTKIKKDFY